MRKSFKMETQFREHAFRSGLLHPLFKALQRYHHYQVVGLENIPAQGRVIIAVNHSVATYDTGLLFTTIIDELGRMPRSLGDRLIFKVPKFSDLMSELGVVEGNQDNAHRLLNHEELVFVAPGGMREALRPSTQKYRLMWQRRLGFARLAMETQTPIVLAMCPHADDLYEISESKVTKILYKEFKIPLPFARGLGFTFLPRPIKLTHYLSKPIKPPKMPEDPVQAKLVLARFHARLCKKAQKIMDDAVNITESTEN